MTETYNNYAAIDDSDNVIAYGETVEEVTKEIQRQVEAEGEEGDLGVFYIYKKIKSGKVSRRVDLIIEE